MDSLPFADLPNACAHEHWGSFDAIGSLPEGYRADVQCGATPRHPTTFFDILLDPYFRGQMAAQNEDPDSIAHPGRPANIYTWARRDPAAAFTALTPRIRHYQLTGTYQCIRRGILALYDTDIIDLQPDRLAPLNDAVARSYAAPFSWYRETMKRMNFASLIRPVHPEYYFRKADPGDPDAERSLTRTVIRIDPLLAFWAQPCPRRDALAKLIGIAPCDAESWRAFLAKLFDIAAANGAVGIKQLQAYSRSLDFPKPDDSEVRWQGDLDPDQQRTFKNWVVNECCRLADKREWPHQIHVGTHNLAQSSPLPLTALATRYPRMKLVLLHCWPFLKESGWLAKHHANVFLDSCWLAILNPDYYSDAIASWISYVPAHKIMCSHDATSIEMAAGSALFVRERLARALTKTAGNLSCSPQQTEAVARAFLCENAASVYPT